MCLRHLIQPRLDGLCRQRPMNLEVSGRILHVAVYPLGDGKMLPKTSKSFGGRGTGDDPRSVYAEQIGLALRNDVGGTHQAVKTILRWTGASERAITNWISGEHGPSGPHLALLAHHSDAVLTTFLTLAGRELLTVNVDLEHLKTEVTSLLTSIDRLSKG